MREIKFRAWDKVNLRWETRMCLGFDGEIVGCNHREDFVVVQHTGLLDENGVAIWEGDIVKGFGKIYLVEWHDGGLLAYKDPHEWAGLAYNDRVDFEVIGNVYETPELLKETA